MAAMHPVAGTTMVVIGLGGIGSALADRAAAFGIQVLGVRHDPAKGGPASVAEVVGAADLHAVLPRADWVVVAAPSTAETQSLIGQAALAAMKPSAVLVNVARGSLVDEQALIAALQDGRIAAAALDVTRTEPLPADDPLWDAPNLYLSPHTSGTAADYSDRLVDLFAENLARFCRGETLRNLVDPDLGY
jgi:phosphoglycerate dehydrogenase-like enzyme